MEITTELYLGDSREQLKFLSDNSVDLIVTSPPYADQRKSTYGGLENLSLIPGKLGAVPIQNIGAYGVEMKDCFVALKAMDIRSGQIVELLNNECKFGYRSSIFKNKP